MIKNDLKGKDNVNVMQPLLDKIEVEKGGTNKFMYYQVAMMTLENFIQRSGSMALNKDFIMKITA